MYNTKKEKKYYLYRTSRGSSIEFENFERLILHIQADNHTEWWDKNKPHNYYLEDLAMNFNDCCKIYYGNESEYNIHYKEYLVYDEDYKTIDLRNFKDLIFSEDYHIYLNNKYKRKLNFTKYYRYRRHIYIYRKTPVPFTSKHRNGGYKGPKIRKEVKDSIGIDKEYLRLSRFNTLKYMLFDWDCYRNKRIKSWKNQSKKKRQWM